VSRLNKLLEAFRNHIDIPWRENVAPAQRVIFCIYNPSDELRLRARIDEFQLASENSKHEWLAYDLTDTFANWLSDEPYATKYFENPSLLPMIIPRYLDYILDKITRFINSHAISKNHVLALFGIGSLFGLLKVKELVDKLAPQVPGRFVLFFPGTCEDNNYRLLDGYDGWNYHAVPITAGND